MDNKDIKSIVSKTSFRWEVVRESQKGKTINVYYLVDNLEFGPFLWEIKDSFDPAEHLASIPRLSPAAREDWEKFTPTALYQSFDKWLSEHYPGAGHLVNLGAEDHLTKYIREVQEEVQLRKLWNYLVQGILFDH